MKKKLIKTALRIVEIEKELMAGKNISSFSAEFDEITKKLSVADMLEIDAYITENNLLGNNTLLLTK
jgi:hypothetical protein